MKVALKSFLIITSLAGLALITMGADSRFENKKKSEATNSLGFTSPALQQNTPVIQDMYPHFGDGNYIVGYSG